MIDIAFYDACTVIGKDTKYISLFNVAPINLYLITSILFNHFSLYLSEISLEPLETLLCPILKRGGLRPLFYFFLITDNLHTLAGYKFILFKLYPSYRYPQFHHHFKLVLTV